MSNRIDPQMTGLDYDALDAESIRGLRSAVAERIDSSPIAADVAPLWNELLPPIEALTAADTADGRPLQPPETSTPAERAVALRTAAASLREIAETEGGERAADVAEIVERYVELQLELVGRSRV